MVDLKGAVHVEKMVGGMRVEEGKWGRRIGRECLRTYLAHIDPDPIHWDILVPCGNLLLPPRLRGVRLPVRKDSISRPHLADVK